MRRVLAVLTCLGAAGCTCGGAVVTGQTGELAFVLTGPAGEQVGPALTATLGPVGFGGLANRAVALRNVGEASVGLESVAVTLGAEAFSVEQPAARTVEPGQDVPLLLAFSAPPADGQQRREDRGALTVRATGVRPGQEVLSLALLGVAEARDCLVSTALDFGLASPGQSVTLRLGFTNEALEDATVRVEGPTGPGASDFFLPAGDTVVVPAGGRASLPVDFRPVQLGSSSASLTVHRTACPDAEVALLGAGSGEALTWAPAALDLGAIPLGLRATGAVVVTNRSGAPVRLSDVALTGDAAFATGSGQEREVPARSSVSLDVSFAPTALGPQQADLRFRLPTGLTARVPLQGRGGGPRIRVEPSQVGFGSVPVSPSGSPSRRVTRRLVVTNTGTPSPQEPALTALRLGVEGRPPLALVTPLNSGTQASEFSLRVPSTYDPALGLPAHQGANRLTLEVGLEARSAGLKEADLTLYSNDALTPAVTVRLRGLAVEAQDCPLGVSPAVLDFGPVPTGTTAVRTVTFFNPGPGTCLVAGLELSADTASAFSAQGLEHSFRELAPLQSLGVTVGFVAPPLAPGTTLTGGLRYASSSTTFPSGEVPFLARVRSCVEVVPESLDFKAVRTGCRSREREVYLYNTCLQPGNVSLQGVSTTPDGGFEASTTALPGTGLTPGAAPLVVGVRAVARRVGTQTDDLVVQVLENGAARAIVVPLAFTGDLNGVVVESFQQPERPKADVLFTIDNSCSMLDKQQSLASNFDSFIRTASTRQTDYQLGVITTDEDEGGRLVASTGNPAILTPALSGVASLFSSKARVGTGGSGAERPLATTTLALTPPLVNTVNAGFVRADATLAVVVVTDATDQSAQPASYYLNRLLSVKGHDKPYLFSFSVIGPFATPRPDGCSYDGTSEFADLRFGPLVTSTRGVRSEICTSNWARDLETLGRNILGERYVFPINDSPEGSSLSVRVDGQLAGSYTFDPATNAVVFSSSAIPPPRSTVSIQYTARCF